MVLSNTKLKRRKREEVAAVAALAPPPDSNATASSGEVEKFDKPATLSSKKKRPRAKKASAVKGDGKDGTVIDVAKVEADAAANGASEITVERSTVHDEAGLQPKKQRKYAPEVELTQDTPMDFEKSGDKLPDFTGGDAVVSEENGGGAATQGNPGLRQADGAPKTKIRKKPRWEVDESGKRIRPAKAGGEGQGSSEHTKVSAFSANGTDKADGTNGLLKQNEDGAVVVPDAVNNGDRIHQGDEPWLESRRKKEKKKRKLTDRKKAVEGAAVGDEQTVNPDVPEDMSSLEEKVDPKKIMVGGMPYYITEDDIHEFFQDFGTIAELDCMTFPDTGKFRGIAFITFRTEEAAKRALALDGADMGGRFLKIEVCKIRAKEPVKKDLYKEPPKKYGGCLSAYIGNLSWEITEKELRKFFKECKIDAVRFATDKETGEFRGFGHVDFADDESLEAAMKLDQELVLDRPLKIAYSVPKRNQNSVPLDVSSSQSGAKKKGCFTCGEEGHLSYNCPKKPLT